MKEPQIDKLQEVTRATIAKVRRFKDRCIGEQNTKATLIEPILEALGWDIRDPDEVHCEYKPTSRDSPVDYSLTILRKPRLFVEAKGLGENLSDRKWIAQVLGYATVAGVEWCVLTDGDEYRFYNATAPLDAEEKLFCQTKLSEDAECDASKTLMLISRSNMEENILDVLWTAHYVDRRVKMTILNMSSSQDKALIRLIRQREPKLNPKDILESLRRLDIRIESVTPIPATTKPLRKPRAHPQTSGPNHREAKKVGVRTKAHFGITLSELIRAGHLSPPLKLFRKYKGIVLEATLLPTGSVEFQGENYPSCSTAAEIARSTVTGQRMHTNGWDFWQYLHSGRKRTLFEARESYMNTKSS